MFQGHFTYQTIVKADKNDVWDFFENPRNLEELTTFPKVIVLSSDKTDIREVVKLRVYAGMITFSWEAVVTESKKPHYFVDKGERLPFPLIDWKHQHSFTQWGSMTGITDSVYFKSYVPAWIVKAALQQMFKARKQAVKKLFNYSNV
ncbi:hypothetical protein D7Z54_30335 [Salibacterium salarium]|uniref:Ligand-binding SRPBCC domain-containing protein n=1 Tax=Salibacterium salarium TaxID=284579 RepID=A0A3R9P2H4_9BACI|nr:hypothetical protein [Salibacterium salarium]RSL29594.1 hypothetical protein D7Z54_30335 [Salibacterium salarium]